MANISYQYQLCHIKLIFGIHSSPVVSGDAFSFCSLSIHCQWCLAMLSHFVHYSFIASGVWRCFSQFVLYSFIASGVWQCSRLVCTRFSEKCVLVLCVLLCAGKNRFITFFWSPLGRPSVASYSASSQALGF